MIRNERRIAFRIGLSLVGLVSALLVLGVAWRHWASVRVVEASTLMTRSDNPAPPLEPDDWPWWRGPDHDSVSRHGNPPLVWSASHNVLWKVPLPGEGHASPVVRGQRVFVATADDGSQAQMVVCLDRESGGELWRTEIHHH